MTHSDVAATAQRHAAAGSKASIVSLIVLSGTVREQRAQLTLKIGVEHRSADGVSTNGPLDAIAHAVHKILGREAELQTYKAKSSQHGTGAEGEVVIRVLIGGRKVVSRARGTDTNLAFARAYLGVFNR